MANDNKSTVITLVILAGILIQTLFAFADAKETPARVAVNYYKAYFMLDKSMADYLCKGLAINKKGNFADKYIYDLTLNTQQRGFNEKYIKSTIYNLRTYTDFIDRNLAKVRITGDRRKCINPVFTLFAKVFNLGKTYTFDKSVNVIKQRGGWKVCK
jgi:hypothetical protein